MPEGQIVDVQTGNDEKPDDSAKYLAEHNNKVAKETRSRDQTAFYGKAMAKQTTNHAPDPALKPPTQTHLKGNQGTGTDDGAQKEKAEIGHHEIPVVQEKKQLAMLEKTADGDVATPDDATRSKGNSNRFLVTPSSMGATEPNPGSLGHAGTPDAPNLTPRWPRSTRKWVRPRTMT